MATERENIEKVQKHLASIKKRAQEEMDRWKEAGDPVRMNAWYRFKNAIETAHGDATEDLLSLFPEHSGIVTLGGGGGR